MQVSWIEPDQLRDLVGQLQRPAAPTNAVPCELHTLPNPAGLGARELGIEDDDLWLPDESSASAAPVVPVNEAAEQLFQPAPAIQDRQPEVVQTPEPQTEQPEEDVQDEQAGMPGQSKELDRIRDKLQAIRERAIEAGLLAHVGVTTEVPLEETPPPVPAPEMTAISGPVSEPEPPSPSTNVEEAQENLLPISSPFSLAEPVTESEPGIASEPSSDFEAPPGALTDRMEAFASWAGRQFGLSDLLIVDDHGDILWGIHEQAGLVVSAMMACKAAMRSSALGAAGLSNVIEQPISIDRMLVVVPCETSYGTLSIAFVRDGGFPQSDAQLLRNALLSAIESPAEPGSTPPHADSALD